MSCISVKINNSSLIFSQENNDYTDPSNFELFIKILPIFEVKSSRFHDIPRM